MTKTFCDRCEREFDFKRNFPIIKFRFKDRDWEISYNVYTKGESQDLCRGCITALMIEHLTPIANFKGGEPPQFKDQFSKGRGTEGIQWAEMRKNAEEAIHKLADELHKEQDKMTREQFREALLQAIKSGDFVKHVSVSGNAQSVVYWPYRKKVELERKIEVLQALLDRVEPATIGRDFRSKSIETLCEDIRKERQ